MAQTTTPSKTSLILPNWSQPTRPSLGRDPLGIQATSVRVYRGLVPGLTNVTNRLRYYSFYCWVVRHYELTRHAEDEAAWRIFIRRAEALYVLACELHDPERTDGLAGSDWARKYLSNHTGARIQLHRHTDKPGEAGADQYLLALRGNFGQFYVSSMTEVGLLQPTRGIPLVSRPRGEDLADAFGLAIGEAIEKLIARILVSGILETKDALIVGKAVHPASINAGSKEMRLLRDFLLANQPEPVDGTPRRSSAWLLLDLARRGISLDDEDGIRRAFYYRMLVGKNPYRQTGEIIDRWRVYQANEICHIALEIWLNAVALMVQKHQGSIAPSVVIGELVAGAVKARDIQGSWRAWAARNATPDVNAEEALTLTVVQALRRPDEPPESSALHAATKLLANLWFKWGNDTAGVRKSLQYYAGVSGRSLSHVLASLDLRADGDARSAILGVLQEHVVENHLIIAARKLAVSDKFTYRFLLSDGMLSDGITTGYGYTNPRLRNLARFLRDAKLCDGDTLTSAGEKFLDENKPA
jgi:hypothetical protein